MLPCTRPRSAPEPVQYCVVNSNMYVRKFVLGADLLLTACTTVTSLLQCRFVYRWGLRFFRRYGIARRHTCLQQASRSSYERVRRR